MNEACYDKVQPYFAEKFIQLPFMHTNSFLFNINYINIIKDLHNLKDLFEFSNVNKNHEIFRKKIKKTIGKFKIETPKSKWIDEFIASRSKAYSFKCENDNENILKGISKPQTEKKIKFEEFYNFLFGREYQKESDNSKFRSLNHELFCRKYVNLHYQLLINKTILYKGS